MVIPIIISPFTLTKVIRGQQKGKSKENSKLVEFSFGAESCLNCLNNVQVNKLKSTMNKPI